MRLDDLLDVSMLHWHLDNGNVKAQRHPTEDLWILNYTAQCQYSRAWDPVTRKCRGLIVTEVGVGVADVCEVVARPFEKFFNYGEDEAAGIDLYAKCSVVDKLDGSLGILYPTTDGHAIATRGSFTSEQAVRGTEFLKAVEGFTPREGYTYLFEIIYPENRIVVDYKGYSGLVCLGVIENETGLHWGARMSGWEGKIPEPAPAGTLAEALALEPRENAEGLVCYFFGTGHMLKIKQEDYVALHKLVTGLNEKVIWARMGEGQTVEEICAALPDEFHEFVQDTALVLQFHADHTWYDVRDTYEEIMNEIAISRLVWDRSHRKAFAEKALKYPSISSYLFTMLDGKDVRPEIWKNLKPKAERTLLAITEDNA